MFNKLFKFVDNTIGMAFRFLGHFVVGLLLFVSKKVAANEDPLNHLQLVDNRGGDVPTPEGYAIPEAQALGGNNRFFAFIVSALGVIFLFMGRFVVALLLPDNKLLTAGEDDEEPMTQNQLNDYYSGDVPFRSPYNKFNSN